MDCQYHALWTHTDVRHTQTQKTCQISQSFILILFTPLKQAVSVSSKKIRQGEGYQSCWCLIEHFVKYLLLFCVCHFSILPYQFHWKHRAAKRDIPAATISTNAIRYDLWGAKPAVAIDSNRPSKLQGIKKLPDLMPLNVFLATSSAFIAPEEAEMILVSCGLNLVSAISPKTLISYIQTKERIQQIWT